MTMLQRIIIISFATVAESIPDNVVHEDIATIDSHVLTFYGICKECYKKGLN